MGESVSSVTAMDILTHVTLLLESAGNVFTTHLVGTVIGVRLVTLAMQLWVLQMPASHVLVHSCWGSITLHPDVSTTLTLVDTNVNVLLDMRGKAVNNVQKATLATQ